MAERYISIINLSLIIATIYCAYNYTHIDKSDKQKHINYILALTLIYNINYIYINNRSMKILYLMGSLSSVFLLTWISNYKTLKSRRNTDVKVFYFINMIFLLNTFIYKGINKYFIVFPIFLILLNIIVLFKNLGSKNNRVIIISILIFFANIFIDNKYIYLLSWAITLTTSVNILVYIAYKSIYKTFSKEKEAKSELKRKELNTKLKLDKLKHNKIITADRINSVDRKNKLLDLILNQSNKCVLIVDKDGYILNEDDSFTNLWNEYKNYKYKIKLSYFLKNSIKNNIEVLLDVQKVYDLGVKVTGEIASKDGRYFKCEYAPFKVSKYNIGVICVITDITYKKQSQLQISENQTKYKKIIETIPYNILLTDENNIKYTNNNMNLNVYDKNLKDLIIDTQKSGEFSYICEDGKEKNIIINKTNFLEDNEIKNLVILRDVTSYIQLLDNIKTSRKKYETLVNTIPEGIYMWNMEDERCVYANDKAFEILGATNLNDINKSDINNKIRLSSSNLSDVVKFTRHKIKTNYGSEVYIELGSITMEINNIVKGIGIIRDITEQVKAENIEKEIRRKKLEYKQKNDFFVNMSHELKTPLNLITSTNQLVQSVYKDEILNNPKCEIARVTNIVKKQGYISLGLIENIITLTKLESDFYESSLDCYDIVSIVEDIIIELNKYLKDNNIQIIFDTYTEEKVINVDPYDIERILLAIFSKIIKEANKNSLIYVYISDENENVNIFIENKGGHNKNTNLNKQSKDSINLNIEVAKSIIKLYNGSIDIMETENDINIEINIKVNSKVDYYNKKERVLNSESIYAEYARINVL